MLMFMVFPNKTKRTMTSEELRAIQAPIKANYKENPEAGIFTLKVKGKAGEGITCSIETGKAFIQAGLHPATGGDGLSLCSGDMLLEALVACAGVTLKSVATAIGFQLDSAEILAEGDLDFRGTLAVSKEVPVGFSAIRLHFNIMGEEDPEKLQNLIRLTERYCVVLQTLKGSAILGTSSSLN